MHACAALPVCLLAWIAVLGWLAVCFWVGWRLCCPTLVCRPCVLNSDGLVRVWVLLSFTPGWNVNGSHMLERLCVGYSLNQICVVDTRLHDTCALVAVLSQPRFSLVAPPCKASNASVCTCMAL